MTEITSKEIASLAGHVLADPDASPEAKRLAGSALTQYETREPAEPASNPHEGVIYLGCARMGLAGASDDEVLNYVRIAKQRAIDLAPPVDGQAQSADRGGAQTGVKSPEMRMDAGLGGGAQNAGTGDAKQLPPTAEEEAAWRDLEKKQ